MRYVRYGLAESNLFRRVAMRFLRGLTALGTVFRIPSPQDLMPSGFVLDAFDGAMDFVVSFPPPGENTVEPTSLAFFVARQGTPEGGLVETEESYQALYNASDQVGISFLGYTLTGISQQGYVRISFGSTQRFFGPGEDHVPVVAALFVGFPD